MEENLISVRGIGTVRTPYAEACDITLMRLTGLHTSVDWLEFFPNLIFRLHYTDLYLQ